MGDLRSAPWLAQRGEEGIAGLFQLPDNAPPIAVEAVGGRTMVLVPGDLFLASPGNRESVRWVVGLVPEGGLIPGHEYCLLSESGVVGTLLSDSPSVRGGLARVVYRGAVIGPNSMPLRLVDFAPRPAAQAADAGADAYLVLGTSVEVGKTTAGLMLLRTLLARGYEQVVVLKATGTNSLAEADLYRDFGAAEVLDCADFGVPATFPCGRSDAAGIFGPALDYCLSLAADALLIECGGDFMGTCVPEFLKCLLPRRPNPTTLLAAGDVSGALGAKLALETMGITVNLITGPCTDTETSRLRVEAKCGTPARSMHVL